MPRRLEALTPCCYTPHAAHRMPHTDKQRISRRVTQSLTQMSFQLSAVSGQLSVSSYQLLRRYAFTPFDRRSFLCPLKWNEGESEGGLRRHAAHRTPHAARRNPIFYSYWELCK